MENLAQILDTMILIEFYNSTDINNISIHDIKTFLEKVHQLEDCPIDSLKLLNVNLTALLPELNCTGERNLKLIKTQLLKKNFSQNLKDLIEITYFEFTKSLENIQKFWIQKQASLKDDVKEILPELLKTIYVKIKEWYNIDAPEYITNIKTVEETSNREILKDITVKFNQTTSPISLIKRLKFSLSRERIDDKENYDSNKILKTHDESLTQTIEEINRSRRKFYILVKLL